jgi:hypothetical protein
MHSGEDDKVLFCREHLFQYFCCAFAGLSFYTTEEELKDVFSPFGNVKEGMLSVL